MIPSKWTAALLRHLALPGHVEDVLGDLHEMHRRRVQRRGRVIAHTLTAFDTLDMAVALYRQRVRRENLIGAALQGRVRGAGYPGRAGLPRVQAPHSGGHGAPLPRHLHPAPRDIRIARVA